MLPTSFGAAQPLGSEGQLAWEGAQQEHPPSTADAFCTEPGLGYRRARGKCSQHHSTHIYTGSRAQGGHCN